MSGFGGIGGVNPIFASILAQPFQAAALRPGQVLQGLVQSVGPQTLIRFGGLVIPVERVEALEPGQQVSAEVVRGEGGLQLRITPGAVHSPPLATETAASLLRDLPGIIVNALQSLGKLDLAEQAAGIVPRAVAGNTSAVRLVLSLLLGPAESGGDAFRAARIVRQAIDQGVVSERDLHDLLSLLRGMAADDVDDTASLMRHAASVSQRPVAARMAEAVSRGDVHQLLASLADDVPTALTRLSLDDAFAEFLRQSGQSNEFHQVIRNLVDRFAATQLINARGTDVPYLFLAMPVAVDSPLRFAHIHVMGEGGGKSQRFDAKNVTVVFDISTTSLGELWITMTAAHGACSCWIRASDLDAVALIQSHADELAGRLSRAGYAAVDVRATLWDGDRVRELAAMMRRFKGIDVEA